MWIARSDTSRIGIVFLVEDDDLECDLRPVAGRVKTGVGLAVFRRVKFLTTNEGRPSREGMMLIRIYEELWAVGYDGSYDANRRYAKGWAKNRGSATAQAYVPLYYALGEAYALCIARVDMIDCYTGALRSREDSAGREDLHYCRAFPPIVPDWPGYRTGFWGYHQVHRRRPSVTAKPHCSQEAGNTSQGEWPRSSIIGSGHDARFFEPAQALPSFRRKRSSAAGSKSPFRLSVGIACLTKPIATNGTR